MKINGREVVGDKFAYEGCHKMYVLKNDQEVAEATEAGYEIHPIEELEEVYEDSCDLRFISPWDLDGYYVKQFENAVFEL